MKTTENFQKVIETHLQNMAQLDTVFAIKLQNPNKNIDDCIRYILNTVKKSQCNGFTDAEIYGMANHYYDEQNVEPVGDISMRVVVNHHIELSEEDIQAQKQKALDEIVREEKNKLLKKVEKKPKVQISEDQFSLF
jgi:hypothetical protein